MDAREQIAHEDPGRARDVHERPAPGSRALRRLVLLCLVLAATALAACGSDEPSADQEEAQALLERSLAKEVKSADLTLDLEADLRGVPILLGKPLELTLKGPFQSNGTTKLPTLDWDVRASGAGRAFSAGVVATEENAFVLYGDEAYEVGEDLIDRFVREARSQSESKKKTTLADLGLNPGDWIEDAEVSPGEAVGGVATTRVSGKLDVGEVLHDLNDAFQSESVRRQLGGRKLHELSDEEIQDVEDAVEDPRFVVEVGKSDGLLRRMRGELKFDVPEDAQRELSGLQGGSLSFGITLDDVNEPVEVAAPDDAKPLTDLLRQLGIPPALLLGAGAAVPTPQ